MRRAFRHEPIVPAAQHTHTLHACLPAASAPATDHQAGRRAHCLGPPAAWLNPDALDGARRGGRLRGHRWATTERPKAPRSHPDDGRRRLEGYHAAAGAAVPLQVLTHTRTCCPTAAGRSSAEDSSIEGEQQPPGLVTLAAPRMPPVGLWQCMGGVSGADAAARPAPGVEHPASSCGARRIGMRD